MDDAKPSFTAEGAAAFRAMMASDSDPEIRNNDTLAVKLIGSKFRFLATTPWVKTLTQRFCESKFPGLISWHNARTRFIDQFVLQELKRGAEQVIILGAGLDSRAYRFDEQLAGRTVIEVDHPATQAWKKQRLSAALGAVPSHVQFVSIDFMKESLSEGLTRVGIKLQKKTCFVWEGVTLYLSDAVVDEVLRFLAGAATGSTITFDYIALRDTITNPSKYFAAKKQMDFVKKRGEPYRWGLDFDHAKTFLADRGWALESNLNAAAMEERYLRQSDGKLRTHTMPFAAIASARVGSALTEPE